MDDGRPIDPVRRTKVAGMVLIGVFMALLDLFIVTIALPAIHRYCNRSSLADPSRSRHLRGVAAAGVGMEAER
jgi:hypothetical protein